jgi:hypothetical protein
MVGAQIALQLVDFAQMARLAKIAQIVHRDCSAHRCRHVTTAATAYLTATRLALTAVANIVHLAQINLSAKPLKIVQVAVASAHPAHLPWGNVHHASTIC